MTFTLGGNQAELLSFYFLWLKKHTHTHTHSLYWKRIRHYFKCLPTIPGKARQGQHGHGRHLGQNTRKVTVLKPCIDPLDIIKGRKFGIESEPYSGKGSKGQHPTGWVSPCDPAKELRGSTETKLTFFLRLLKHIITVGVGWGACMWREHNTSHQSPLES